MTIPITGTLVPVGLFPGMNDAAISGGLHVVANAAARDAIPTAGSAAPAGVRVAGMIAITADDKAWWQLQDDLITWAPVQPGVLLGTLHLYVAPGAGDDANSGLDPSEPLDTLAGAWAKVGPFLAASLIVHMASATGVAYTSVPGFVCLNKNAQVIIWGDGAGQTDDDGFTEIETGTLGTGSTRDNVRPSSGSFTPDEFLGYTLEVQSTSLGVNYYRTIRNNEDGDPTGIVPVGPMNDVDVGDVYRVLQPGCVFDIGGAYAATDIGLGDTRVTLINLSFEGGSLQNGMLQNTKLYGVMGIGEDAGFGSTKPCLGGCTTGSVEFCIPELWEALEHDYGNDEEWEGWGLSAPNGSVTSFYSNFCTFQGYLVSFYPASFYSYYAFYSENTACGGYNILGGYSPGMSFSSLVDSAGVVFNPGGIPFLTRPGPIELGKYQWGIDVYNISCSLQGDALSFDCSDATSLGGGIAAYDSKVYIGVYVNRTFDIDAGAGTAVFLNENAQLTGTIFENITWVGATCGLELSESSSFTMALREGAVVEIASDGTNTPAVYLRDNCSFTTPEPSAGTWRFVSDSGIALLLENRSTFSRTLDLLECLGGAGSNGAGIVSRGADFYCTIQTNIDGYLGVSFDRTSRGVFGATVITSTSVGLQVSGGSAVEFLSTCGITTTAGSGVTVTAAGSLSAIGIMSIGAAGGPGISLSCGTVYGQFDITSADSHGIVATGVSRASFTDIVIDASLDGVRVNMGSLVALVDASPEITAGEYCINASGGGLVYFQNGTPTLSAGIAELRVSPSATSTFASALTGAGTTYANTGSGSAITRNS